MITYRGERVSASHKKILTAYERKYGQPVQINDGQRNKADQLQRIKDHGYYDADTNPHGAARYSPDAPHVKEDHENHALDINSGKGIGQRDHVAAFYRSLGIKGVVFNVSTESWHVDFLDEASLKAAAKKIKVDPALRYSSSGAAVVTLKKLLDANGIKGFSSWPDGRPSNNRFNAYFGRNTRNAVKRFQTLNNMKPDGIVGPSTWKALRS